jgi:hypothetical protein
MDELSAGGQPEKVGELKSLHIRQTTDPGNCLLSLDRFQMKN